MLLNQRARFAAKLAGCHLIINIIVAVLVAILVFYIWYPYPYRQMLGGLGLFSLVIGIDVVCGPVLTAVLANPKKSTREMLVDIALVAIIQISALVYGLHTVAIARPVAVVFEVDRFVVVSSVDIHQESLAKAVTPFNRLPWFGPERVAIRQAHDAAEKDSDLTLSLQGIEPSMRPERWEADSSKTREAIRQRMQPVSQLQQYYPQNIELTAAIQKSGIPTEKLYFLPFTSHNNKEWAVLLDERADFKGFVPVDAFLPNH
ncbi:fimb protein [Eikenella corrodens]|jgi:fimB|uniref:Fimb protein n=1 Tax=Eikenella corrodens TaxID=539 RepID=A0A1A9RFM3_EIKCO|nr:TfpX/TfpZ family type IV pilin accessory protein [Eikenella corrodens]OAM17224.1 fimb protein [Eikenella corrodens]OAM23939.1 fimb protein [Eikenella corrodens]